jgi:hypothetical protein
MRYLLAAPMIALFIAAPVGAASAPKESWGKPGVSLAQYRQDALFCGLAGYYTDISKTDDAKAFVKASNQLDSVTTGASAPMTLESNGTGPDTTNSAEIAAGMADQQQHIVDSVRPDERYKSIKKTLVTNDQGCLASRGYSKFVLTDEQRKRLSKLKAGSEARRAYLYSLATDPNVLQSQRAAQP